MHPSLPCAGAWLPWPLFVVCLCLFDCIPGAALRQHAGGLVAPCFPVPGGLVFFGLFLVRLKLVAFVPRRTQSEGDGVRGVVCVWGGGLTRSLREGLVRTRLRRARPGTEPLHGLVRENEVNKTALNTVYLGDQVGFATEI